MINATNLNAVTIERSVLCLPINLSSAIDAMGPDDLHNAYVNARTAAIVLSGQRKYQNWRDFYFMLEHSAMSRFFIPLSDECREEIFLYCDMSY